MRAATRALRYPAWDAGVLVVTQIGGIGVWQGSRMSAALFGGYFVSLHMLLQEESASLAMDCWRARGKAFFHADDVALLMPSAQGLLAAAVAVSLRIVPFSSLPLPSGSGHQASPIDGHCH